MASLSLVSNNNCSVISLTVSGDGYASWLNSTVNFYQNNFTTATASISLATLAGESYQINLTPELAGVSNLNGVWRIEVIPPAGSDLNPLEYNSTLANTAGIVMSCSIDCCIAKKMNTYLTGSNCNCKSGCSNDKKLIEMSKIFLLLKAAEADVVLNNFQGAYDKYVKASTICNTTSATCGCNC